MATNDTILGHALYFEFHQGTETSQLLAIPELPSPTTQGVIIPPTFYSRSFLDGTTKRLWKIRRDKDFESNVIVAGARSIDRGRGLQDALSEGERALKSIMGLLDGIGVSVGKDGWQPYGDPFALDLSREDATANQIGKPSDDLLQRLMLSRQAKGFPDYPNGLNL